MRALEALAKLPACARPKGELFPPASAIPPVHACPSSPTHQKKITYHLNYQTVRENRQRLDCRRIVLTHMSADMLSRRDEADMECADDGLVIVL